MTIKNKKSCLIFSLICWLASISVHAGEAERQAEVAKRGAEVMPFALEKTQHQFTKTATGGIQRVIVRAAQDRRQIAHIQSHLAQLAVKFQHGDYSGPETIHGPDMPGLAQLQAAKAGGMQIVYNAEPNGASLSYATADPQLLAALHAWFDAQLHDHGHDAMEMHQMHHMQHP